MEIADERQRSWAGQFVQRAGRAALRGAPSKVRDVDENGPVAFHGGTRGETLRPAVAPAGVRAKTASDGCGKRACRLRFRLRPETRPDAGRGPGRRATRRLFVRARHRRRSPTKRKDRGRRDRANWRRERRGRASCNLLQLEPAKFPTAPAICNSTCAISTACPAVERSGNSVPRRRLLARRLSFRVGAAASRRLARDARGS